MTQLPFAIVRDAATPHIGSLLRDWLPAGKRVGNEWVCGDTTGSPGRSLSINLITGVGADFATHQKFADIIDVCAEVCHGGDKRAAVIDLAARFGVPYLNGHASASTTSPARTEKPRAQYLSAPPPEDAPPAPTLQSGIKYTYRDAAGRALWYLWRTNDAESGKKKFLPLSWGSINGEVSQWHWKHPMPPRSLYGLDRLAARPDAPVLVVEGEKAADSASEKFPNHVCVTWPGGASSVSRADWSPLAGRSVIVWPDNDAPGLLAARQISARLSDAVILRVDDLRESADAADIDAPDDPAQWLRARLPSCPEDAAITVPDTPRAIAAPPDQIPIRVIGLGYDHGRWYYYSSATRQITTFRANDHTRQQLCAMAPTDYWYRTYQHHCGESGSLSWPEVAADLMQSCRAAGVYDPDRVRGRGVWRDGARVIAHLGNRLIVDGASAPLVLPESQYIYEVARPLLPGAAALPLPLTSREAVGLEKICRALRWEQKSAGRLLAGWLVLASICGALSWRPSVWITGGAGSGKTWISNNITRRVLGFASIYVSLSTTEPSLRRLLGADALPVIWDEGEPDTPAAVARLTAILGLVRQGSSESDAIVARASPDGGVDVYKIRTMACFQSINAPIWTQADISRIEILGLRDYSIDGDLSFGDLRALVAEHLSDDFGARLFSRSIQLVPVIRANAEIFATAIAHIDGQTQRRADQIGALLAGAFSLHSERLITPDEAMRYAAEDAWVQTETPAPETRDERRVIMHLLAHRLRIGTIEYPISRLVEMAISHYDGEPLTPETARQVLMDAGIKILELDGRPGIAISVSHPVLRDILYRTPWESSWGRALARLPGAVGGRGLPVLRFGLGIVGRAVWIPLTTLD